MLDALFGVLLISDYCDWHLVVLIRMFTKFQFDHVSIGFRIFLPMKRMENDVNLCFVENDARFICKFFGFGEKSLTF